MAKTISSLKRLLENTEQFHLVQDDNDLTVWKKMVEVSISTIVVTRAQLTTLINGLSTLSLNNLALNEFLEAMREVEVFSNDPTFKTKLIAALTARRDLYDIVIERYSSSSSSSFTSISSSISSSA